MAVPSRLVGKSLAGRYDVLELVGEGGMGEVYRVRDRELDEIVALKVIRHELAEDPAVVERFRSEVKLARRVTHGNVARTFELGRAGAMLFCTMELLDGESLARYLRRHAKLPAGEAVAIACAVLEGLAAAHAAGVIHRDIKPENVMMTSSGRIVVTDFGIASGGAGNSDGTPAYMAPEQMRGEAPTPATDVYAVGVMLFELVSGRRAFDGSVIEIFEAKQTSERVTVPPGLVPDELAAVIAQATARDVAARIHSAAALREALAPWAPAAPRVAARPAATPELDELSAIVVHPPRGEASRLYIAEAIHADLLQRLARTPRVRVHTRDLPGAALVVELIVEEVHGGELVIVAGGKHLARLALAVDLVTIHAETAATAIVAALSPRGESAAALDLLLRARNVAQQDVARLSAGMELLEQAATLAPESAQIAASLAIAKLQRVFFTRGDRSMLDRAGELVQVALHAGPDLVETHLAAGLHELHTGEAAQAAAHFRIAISLAPHSATAHEQLGRMLLEAGYLDAGYARLADALAIAPHMMSVRWEIARARAIAQNWEDYDRLVAELPAEQTVLSRIRFMTWRGDPELAREMRAVYAERGEFERELFVAVLAVVGDGAWAQQRAWLVATAHDSARVSRRLRSLVGQLVAEAAGIAGDLETCETMIALASEHGLFDLLWLEHCPLIAGVRTRERFAELRAPVKARADAILDALYGDHPVRAYDATAPAPSGSGRVTTAAPDPRETVATARE